MDTTITFTNFVQIFNDIQLNRFYYTLPASIKKLEPKDEKSRNEYERNPKKQKEAQAVQNNKLVREWKLRNNEQWNTIFRGKSREGPELSIGCKPCLKFHLKGWCYEDCNFKASHQELKNEDKQKTETFIKGLRGEA